MGLLAALGTQQKYGSCYAAGTLLDVREPVLSVAEGWTPYGEEIGAVQAGLGFTGEWFDAEVGRFTQVDPWEGEQQIPLSLQPYLYANTNPINYNDPSGYFAESDRLSLLDQKADELHVDRSISAMEKFIGLVQYATTLYSDRETPDFVADLTIIIMKTQGRFDQPTYYGNNGASPQCRKGWCDLGWKDSYRDHTANQAFHFWFYVWVAYETDTSVVFLGNTYHETIDRDAGKSWEDWILGHKGAALGHRLAAWQSRTLKEVVWWGCIPTHKLSAHLMLSVRPSEVPDWLLQNLADPTTFGPAPQHSLLPAPR